MARARTRKPKVTKERVRVAIDALAPHGENPRKHPEAQIEKLVRSLKRFGQTRDVVALARPEPPYPILAGEGTWRAARRAGLAEVDVTLLALPAALAEEYLLADNALARGARDEVDQIAALLEAASARPGYDPEALGFSAAEAAELVAALGEEVEEAIEIDVSDVLDRFWITIRGPLKHQAAALARLEAAMADIGDVDVDLGVSL